MYYPFIFIHFFFLIRWGKKIRQPIKKEKNTKDQILYTKVLLLLAKICKLALSKSSEILAIISNEDKTCIFQKPAFYD